MRARDGGDSEDHGNNEPEWTESAESTEAYGVPTERLARSEHRPAGLLGHDILRSDPEQGACRAELPQIRRRDGTGPASAWAFLRGDADSAAYFSRYPFFVFSAMSFWPSAWAFAGESYSFKLCCPSVPILPYRVVNDEPSITISQNLLELPSMNSK